MQSRRQFLKSSFLFSGWLALSDGLFAREPADNRAFFMPEEGAHHSRTWMAFVANDYVWSKRQIPEVKRNLASIARTIAKYEPVSLLVSPNDYDEARSLIGPLDSLPYPVDLIEFVMDDLWLRDTGPTFVKGRDGKKYGINFNFNGWGNKQEYSHDAKVADGITQLAGANIVPSSLTLEGGCFEVDGEGTAIMTESCIINDNRNPGIAKKQIEQELKMLLGLRKIIWLKGIKGKDITDGHTDFYARFTQPGEVIVSRDNYRPSHDYIVTRENIDVLKNSVDADGKRLKVIVIDTPDEINESYGVRDFAAGYIGYYLCNGAVIAQKFGDIKADTRARDLLSKAYPDRIIEQLAIDGIASGGGSIHCATQQEISA